MSTNWASVQVIVPVIVATPVLALTLPVGSTVGVDRRRRRGVVDRDPQRAAVAGAVGLVVERAMW